MFISLLTWCPNFDDVWPHCADDVSLGYIKQHNNCNYPMFVCCDPTAQQIPRTPSKQNKKHYSSQNKRHWDEDRARCWLACVCRKTEICSGVYAASRKCVRCCCGRLLHIVPNITHRNTILAIWYTHVVNCLCCWRRAIIETVLNGSKCVFSVLHL